jgi:hypothetical protein
MPASPDVDQLYATPLRDFTRARNDLAARLKKAGRTAEAADVKRLQKPTVATWLVNQLARQGRQNVERLVKAVDRLRLAQLHDRDALAQATEDQRAATRALLKRAETIAEDAGLKVPAGVMARVSATLLGAAVDPHERENLQHGRLTSERQAPGFEAFAGTPRGHLRLVPPAPKREEPAPAPAKPSRPSREQVRRQREAERAARAEARERERRVAALRRDAERRRRAAAATAKAADALRTRLQELEERAERERRVAEETTQQVQRVSDDAIGTRDAETSRRPAPTVRAARTR